MKKVVIVDIPKKEAARLESLPNWGAECNRDHPECEDAETIQYLHEGEWDEQFTVCTGCGGSRG